MVLNNFRLDNPELELEWWQSSGWNTGQWGVRGNCSRSREGAVHNAGPWRGWAVGSCCSLKKADFCYGKWWSNGEVSYLAIFFTLIHFNSLYLYISNTVLTTSIVFSVEHKIICIMVWKTSICIEKILRVFFSSLKSSYAFCESLILSLPFH